MSSVLMWKTLKLTQLVQAGSKTLNQPKTTQKQQVLTGSAFNWFLSLSQLKNNGKSVLSNWPNWSP